MNLIENQQKLYTLLNFLNIDYKVYFHDPVFTVTEAQKLKDIDCAQCKNLFLKDDKNNFWLISALDNTKINLKALSKHLNAPGLRFANEELLKKYLNITPGSVTPFALINDEEGIIKVILEKKMLEQNTIGFHPLINSQTLTLKPSELISFIKYLGNVCQIVDIENLTYS